MPENILKRQKSKNFMTLPVQLWSNTDRYLYVNRTLKQVVHKLCKKYDGKSHKQFMNKLWCNCNPIKNNIKYKN